MNPFQKVASLFRASPPKPRQTQPTFAQPFGGRFSWSATKNTTGVQVTEHTALALPALFSGVQTICSDLSALPLELVQVKDGATRKAVEHPAYPIFSRSPDGITTSMRWRSAITAHSILYGSGFAEIVPSVDGSRQYLFLLNPETTLAQWTPDSNVIYFAGGRKVDKESIVHLALLSHDAVSGHPLVRLARQAIGLGLAAETYGGAFIGNASGVAGFFKPPNEIKREAKQEFLSEFEREHGGPEMAGRLGILPVGWAFEETKAASNPQQAQLLDLRVFSVLDVARLLNLPPHKLADKSGESYASIEASNLEYVQSCLLPRAVALEQALNLRLLTDEEIAQGYTFRHDFTELLRADASGRAALYTVLFNTTSINPNEIRAREGMNPRPGGDEYLTPLNMSPSPAPSGGKAPSK